MSIFRRKTGFEFKPLPALPDIHLREPISHVRVKPLPAKVFDWEQEGVSELAEETTDVETPTAHQEGLAPVIGTIGLAGFERDGKIDPTVVNYLQELPARQSDNQ